MTRFIFGLATALMITSSLHAYDFSQDEHVINSLKSAAVAWGIAEECPTMKANRIKGFSKAMKLKKYAEERGATDGSIKSFLDDDVQKSRIYKLRDEYYVDNGASLGNADSLCVLGRQEIEAGSLVGELLIQK